MPMSFAVFVLTRVLQASPRNTQGSTDDLVDAELERMMVGRVLFQIYYAIMLTIP